METKKQVYPFTGYVHSMSIEKSRAYLDRCYRGECAVNYYSRRKCANILYFYGQSLTDQEKTVCHKMINAFFLTNRITL